MFGITNFATFLIGTILIILVPGPNSMYCLSVAGQYGVRTAYRAIWGIIIGDSILMLATALGAGTILKAHPPLFIALKIAGGVYLLGIGVNLIRAGITAYQHRNRPELSPHKSVKPTHIFKRALSLSLSNPKAILFFLTFFVQFIDPYYRQPLITFLALAVVLQIISFAYLNTLAFAGTRLRHYFAHNRILSAIGLTGIGTLFCTFAIKLWTEQI